MAQAKPRTETVEVVKTEEKLVGVTLELTLEEAAYLKGITGQGIAGKTPAGKAFASIYWALSEARIESKKGFKFELTGHDGQSLNFLPN